MRIAVYENLPPGGALRTALEIGKELRQRGHELTLYRLSTSVDKGPLDLTPIASAVEVVSYRPLGGLLDGRLRAGHFAPRSYTLFRPLAGAQRDLASRINAGHYDVTLLFGDRMTSAPYVLHWLQGVPTVYYCQEPLRVASELAARLQHRQNLARSGAIIGQLRVLEDALILGRLADADRENARRADVIAVNSVYSRERVWAAYGCRAVVCYLGVDPVRFRPAASQPRRRELLSLGAPIEAKGHHLIIQALASLRPEPPLALRVVLPRSAKTEGLRNEAGSAGVELIIETGLADAEVVERYQQAMMTVCAGRLEPFGLSALESMACGTPVVAIREAGYRESIIDGITGILVEPDPRSLANGIGRVAADTVLAAALGRAGRQDVLERWTWHRSADQMEAILEGVARRPATE